MDNELVKILNQFLGNKSYSLYELKNMNLTNSNTLKQSVSYLVNAGYLKYNNNNFSTSNQVSDNKLIYYTCKMYLTVEGRIALNNYNLQKKSHTYDKVISSISLVIAMLAFYYAAIK